MSNKSNKKAPGGKGGQGAAQDKMEILQAVVLTDSYKSRFRPLSLTTPRCLLPLANIPLIEYTLEFLAVSGIEDVFIFVSSRHAQKVEKYIKASKWNQPSSPFKTCKIVMSLASMSVGDAMRELDAKGMITTDFLLVNGDFVGNFALEPILKEHRERRKLNPNAIMTMVLSEAGRQHRTKPINESGVFVIDESNDRVVHYDEIRYGGEEQVEIPSELFKSAAQLRVRTDLIDCHVDICSPDVPALFTENFDYADIRRNFVHGILTDTELYGKFVHVKILTSGQHYAARVRSLQTYDAVSRDIINRWTYPFVPDNNLYSDHSYTYERGNIYKEDKIRVGKDVNIGRNTMVGRNVEIRDGAQILDSIIGNNVVIGKNVYLDGVYIWDNTVIGDNTTIRHSIVAENVSIGEKVHIAPGCIIAYNVSIPDGEVLEHGRKLYNPSAADEPSDGESDDAPQNLAFKRVEGEDWDTGSSASDEDEQASNKIDLRTFSRLPTRPFYLHDPESYSTLPSEYSSDTSVVSSGSDSESDADGPHRRSRHHPPRPGSAASSVATDDESPGERDFLREAIPSLLDSMMAGHDASITAMELNSLRMVNNVTFLGVRRAITSALIQRAMQLESPPKYSARVEKVLGDYMEVFTRSLHERNDQVELLQAAQRECMTKGDEGPKWMLAAAQAFYEKELVEEDMLYKWWAVEEAREGEQGERSKKIRTLTAAFIKWLQEAEDESSEEEESEEEEEESDDE